MIVLEIAGGIILAGVLLQYWRYLLLVLIVLLMGASVLLAVMEALGK